MLAGHIHIYQSIEFPDSNANSGRAFPQLVINGNSGVVDVAGLNASPCSFDEFPLPAAITKPAKMNQKIRGKTSGIATWNSGHGYTLWTRSSKSASKVGSGWTQTPVPVGLTDAPLAGPLPCTPAPPK